jgi:hypothetical protein
VSLLTSLISLFDYVSLMLPEIGVLLVDMPRNPRQFSEGVLRRRQPAGGQRDPTHRTYFARPFPGLRCGIS